MTSGTTTITNARLVLPDAVVHGTIRLDGTAIAEVQEAAPRLRAPWTPMATSSCRASWTSIPTTSNARCSRGPTPAGRRARR